MVLLHTEAGGTPAFQSTAASRRNLCGITRRDARVPVRAASRQLSATLTLFTKKSW
ncbi:MAG: hypothetical protein LBQ66_03090 [Planctomycetaceae bacterium]|nr:hypothetical protein [Planctomycetaceae bacterium]